MRAVYCEPEETYELGSRAMAEPFSIRMGQSGFELEADGLWVRLFPTLVISGHLLTSLCYKGLCVAVKWRKMLLAGINRVSLCRQRAMGF